MTLLEGSMSDSRPVESTSFTLPVMTGLDEEGFEARRARLLSGTKGVSWSSGATKRSFILGSSLKCGRCDEVPSFDLVDFALTDLVVGAGMIFGRSDSLIVRRRFILDARGVVGVSEASRFGSVCSTELQLVLEKSVVRGCPFEHKL
jgi:hypothetical protein